MLDRLNKLREERANSDKGFTLIELLVVVVIIGILIAIAIPLYLNYTKGANDKAAESDLRGAISTLEQCNTDNGFYPTAVDSAAAMKGCTSQKINLSKNTTVYYTPIGAPAAPVSYIMEAFNSSGATAVYCYDSSKSGQVLKATSVKVLSAKALTACPA